MPTTQYKKNPNEDTAYFDGHKVNLIAVPAGTLQLPIHPTSDSGYVIDNNGKKHRVLMATFLSGTIDYKDSKTADSAYMTVNGQKVKVRLAVKENGTLTVSDKPNVDKGYVVGDDSEKHRVTLINTPTGTLELPNNETDDSAYIIDGDGNKIKVRMFALLAGGYKEVTVSGVAPLSLPDAVAADIPSLIAFGGTEQRNLPDNYLQRQFIYMMDGSYLLTDLVPTYDCKVEMDFATTSFPGSGSSFIGARSGGPGDGLSLGRSATNYVQFDGFDGNRYTSSTGQFATNTRYKYVWNNQVATLYQGTTTVDTNTFTGTGTKTHPLAINGLNNSGSVVGNIAGIYLYSFKMWNGQGELIADYVPAVQKGTVPVVGFYDTVSETFMTATAGTFAAGAEAVPTPDAPMDILCNNGVLKASRPSGLPAGYTALQYIESTGTQYIDLGVKGNGNNKVDVTFRYHTATSASGSGRVFGSRTNSSSNAFAIGSSSGVVGATGNKVFWCYDAQAFFVIDNPTFPIDDWQNVIFSATEHKLNGTSYGDDYNVVEFETPQNLKLFGFDNSGTIGKGYVDISSCKLWDNGVLIRDLVPAKNASGVIGMYDKVNNVFYTNADESEDAFVAGPNATDPITLVVEGTQETIAITADGATVSSATCENLFAVGNYTDEQEVIAGNVTRKVEVRVLDGTENWGASSTYQGSCWLNLPAASQAGICVCSHFENVPSTSTYARYKVLNEGFAINLWYGDARTTAVTDLKTFLAQQYAAGTPVILLRALTTSTTETVTGQPMETAEGDNQAVITQASLTGLELKVEYEKEAE